MNSAAVRRLTVFLIVIVCVTACTNSSYRTGRRYLKSGDYQSAIGQLDIAEQQQPDNWRIKRDLGIAYYESAKIQQAITKLGEAYKLKPRNGRILLYLGLCFERDKKFKEAIQIYSRYAGLSFLDPVKDELRARIRDIHLLVLQREVKDKLAKQERELLQPTDQNTVAVLYFRNLSNWDEITPLAKGIAAVMTTDLSQVERLRLVEREKLQVLLNELKLSTNEFFDQVNSPRAGLLLGAAHLISGGIERIGDDGMQVSAGVVNTQTGSLVGDGAQVSGNLIDLLRLEKTLVFDLILDMGIRLSNEEIEAIRPLPTQNILAFIAFSKGLDFKDNNLLDQARLEFAKAVKLDPSFRLAKASLEELSKERLSVSTLASLAAYDELLASKAGLLSATDAKIGLRLGSQRRDVSDKGPVFLSPSATIRITGEIPMDQQ